MISHHPPWAAAFIIILLGALVFGAMLFSSGCSMFMDREQMQPTAAPAPPRAHPRPRPHRHWNGWSRHHGGQSDGWQHGWNPK